MRKGLVVVFEGRRFVLRVLRRNFRPVTFRVGICASFELYDTEAEEVKMKLRRAEWEGRLRSGKR